MVDGHTMQVAIEKRVKQVEHRLGGSLMVRSRCQFSVSVSLLTLSHSASSPNGIANTLED